MGQRESIEKRITNVAYLKRKVEYLLDAMAGGTALYRKEGDRFVMLTCSDGLPAIAGYTRGEYQTIVEKDALNFICLDDRVHASSAFSTALDEGQPIRISCRLRTRDGNLLWVRVNLGPIELDGETLLLAIFFDPADGRILRSSGGDAVYVVDVETMELAYVGGERNLWGMHQKLHIGGKCYQELHGRDTPCTGCPLVTGVRDDTQQLVFPNMPDHIFDVKGQRIDWGGRPAYIQYVRDSTEEHRLRRDKDRLDRYYQTLVRYMADGMSVMRWDIDKGRMSTEFISPGIAEILGMTQGEALSIYEADALAGVHPDDRDGVLRQMTGCFTSGKESCRLSYRLQHKRGDYVWVSNNCSFIQDEDCVRIYSVYTDTTQEHGRQEEKQQRYTEMLRHYREGIRANSVMLLMVNVTKDSITDLRDNTPGRALGGFTTSREGFIRACAQMIVSPEERQTFLRKFSTGAITEGYAKGEFVIQQECFVVIPGEEQGRYLRFEEESLLAPDNDDVVGIIFAVDVTMERLLMQAQQRLISDNYDEILAVDLTQRRYWGLKPEGGRGLQVQRTGALDNIEEEFSDEAILLKDMEKIARMKEPGYIRERLRARGPFKFQYSVRRQSVVRTKSALMFSMDEQLRWICFARTDVSNTIRDQQALLRVTAQTFEMVALVALDIRSCVVHTRQSIMEDQPPVTLRSPAGVVEMLLSDCELEEETRRELEDKLALRTILQQLDTADFSLVVETKKNGQPQYKQISAFWNGTSHQGVCIVRQDVTSSIVEERGRTDHLRSALALARDANRAKTDFLSSMSHDIRTPMNAIIGMTDLAMTHYTDPEQVYESLRIIKSSADHLRDLIGDILDMSRIERGRLVLNKVPFSQRERLQAVIERTKVLADQAGVAFTYDIRVEHDACVGDPLRLCQILENLLGNAVKFSRTGGSISLKVEELPWKKPYIGWYKYVVTDNGIGMSQEAIEHLYDPFYREKSSEVARTEGSGLGLSIVKSIVDYKGGTIDVVSEIGKGSEFTVKVPLLLADAKETAKLDERGAAGDMNASCLRGWNILLVEDHPVNSIVAIRLLEDAGARVTSAKNGREGLDRFHASIPGEFDVILMDLQMPEMDGYEATRAIRAGEHPQAQTIPIIAMTANAFAQDVQRCLSMGMDAHISKPVDRQQLMSAILRTTTRRRD